MRNNLDDLPFGHDPNLIVFNTYKHGLKRQGLFKKYVDKLGG